MPAVHLARYGEGVNKNKTFADIYRWSASTVVEILKKREYLGHTVNFKTRKHFKDKKSHYVDESEWTIFENTHEAIIDQETFDNVQRIRGNARRYPDGFGEAHPLTGLMYCADCGGKMYVHRTYNGKRVPQYTCGQYGKYPIGSLYPVPSSGGCGIDCKPAKIRGHAISPVFTRAHLYTVAGAVRPAGGVAYFVHDGKLRSPNPLCALRSQTPTLRLSGSTEPVIPSLKGGVPHRFLSYPHQYHQAQRRPFCCCRSCLPQRNQADK